MAFDGFFSALAAAIPALFLAAGVYIYVALSGKSVRVLWTRRFHRRAISAGRRQSWPHSSSFSFCVAWPCQPRTM